MGWTQRLLCYVKPQATSFFTSPLKIQKYLLIIFSHVLMHSHIVNIDISHMGISLFCRFRLNLELHASEEKGVDKLGHKGKG